MVFILIVYLREFACVSSSCCLPTVTDRRHDERDDVSNHRRHDCLLKRLFMRKKKIKAQRHWLLWGESGGDRWIPLTKGQ